MRIYKEDIFTLSTVSVFVSITLTCVYGYIHNIALIVANSSELTVVLILRIVGIFAIPLGAILGFL